MHNAFISYRRSNGFVIAKLLRELLKAKGISAYMDMEELRNGTFDDKLLTAIESIPAFILILPVGALSNCAKDNDWLTKEIVAAVNSNRNIIPVLCEGFSWPTVWDPCIPEQVRRLSSYNGVVLDYNYLDSTVDKLISYIRGDTSSCSCNQQQNYGQFSDDVELFFRSRMHDLNGIHGVDIAFHSGAAWQEDIERLELLETLADAGIPIRILVNSPEAAESIGQYMRHKFKKYIPFSEAISQWKAFAAMYKNVQVRVCEIPLLRVYFSFRMQDSTEDVIRVKYYTYGNAKVKRIFAQTFPAADPHFNLYRTEFDFLWNQSHE